MYQQDFYQEIQRQQQHLFALEQAQSFGEKAHVLQNEILILNMCSQLLIENSSIINYDLDSIIICFQDFFYNICHVESTQCFWLVRTDLAKRKLWQKLPASLFLCIVQIKWYTHSRDAAWSLLNTLLGVPKSKLSVVSIRWSRVFRECNSDGAQFLKS